MSAVEEIAPVLRKRGRPKINLKRPPGRPTSFTEEKGEMICKALARGQTLKQICADTKMPDFFTVLKWLKKFPEFNQAYAAAKEAQADAWADQIVEIADNSKKSDARSRLMIETRKWLMARLSPKKYGDKTTADLTGTVVLSLADLVNQSIAQQEPKLVEGKEIKADGDEKA